MTRTLDAGAVITPASSCPRRRTRSETAIRQGRSDAIGFGQGASGRDVPPAWRRAKRTLIASCAVAGLDANWTRIPEIVTLPPRNLDTVDYNRVTVSVKWVPGCDLCPAGLRLQSQT